MIDPKKLTPESIDNAIESLKAMKEVLVEQKFQEKQTLDFYKDTFDKFFQIIAVKVAKVIKENGSRVTHQTHTGGLLFWDHKTGRDQEYLHKYDTKDLADFVYKIITDLTPEYVISLITNEPDETIMEYLHNGQKLQAVKHCKEITGLGLKEAKDYVDALADKMKYEKSNYTS